MAEYDRVSRLVTGRQAAHVELFRRHPGNTAPADWHKKLMPDVSVVEWEVHEKVCEPYRIKPLISTTAPVSRKDILGQWARFKFQSMPIDESRWPRIHGTLGITITSPDRYTLDDLIRYVTVLEAKAYSDHETIDQLRKRPREIERKNLTTEYSSRIRLKF